ncbi:unnamed protein product [Porites lobata]|uniref:Sodefrin-like factor n=1 Tax=Porites lobata TaxID=104759 RepID=A0ABN8QGB5_9CNID|nr:unnamed protein product [Porites lobata]
MRPLLVYVTRFIGGCINCSDKKAACAIISGYIKSRRSGLLLTCDIQCCTSNNCNDAAAGLPTCTHCLILAQQGSSQACSLNPSFGSLGTTHCGSVVGSYRDGSGNVKDLAYRGCFDCADKKAACFALGGYLKMARSLTLLECEIDCCTGKNCNTQIPTGSPSANAVKVFTTAASGPKQCFYVWELMRPAARAQRVGGPRFAPLIHFHSVLLTVVLQWVNIRIAKEISWITLFGDALTVLIRKRLVRLWVVFSRETEGKV